MRPVHWIIEKLAVLKLTRTEMTIIMIIRPGSGIRRTETCWADATSPLISQTPRCLFNFPWINSVLAYASLGRELSGTKKGRMGCTPAGHVCKRDGELKHIAQIDKMGVSRADERD